MKDKINKISVVMATYNGEKFLRQQLNSILSQSYPVDELVVVDDHSTDSTLYILEEYLKSNQGIMKIFQNKENKGFIYTFKKALRFSSNNYIAFSDQDDVWEYNKIESQMDEITKVENGRFDIPIVCFHDLKLINKDGVLSDTLSFWCSKKIQIRHASLKSVLLKNVITGCTMLINKQMKDEVLKMPSCEILFHDHWIALIAYGFGVAIPLNNTLIKYRSHTNSVTDKKSLKVSEKLFLAINRLLHKDESYLKENFEQVRVYRQCYLDQIPEGARKTIDSFLSLENKSYYHKLFYQFEFNKIL
ncbi:glycosyltransferase [Limibacterium fermenti]|uniref:glycosyltransferase n=1 Tax=Limibacterium fermenti TaxID=3229863 RepID=UPI003A5F1551